MTYKANTFCVKRTENFLTDRITKSKEKRLNSCGLQGGMVFAAPITAWNI